MMLASEQCLRLALVPLCLKERFATERQGCVDDIDFAVNVQVAAFHGARQPDLCKITATCSPGCIEDHAPFTAHKAFHGVALLSSSPQKCGAAACSLCKFSCIRGHSI